MGGPACGLWVPTGARGAADAAVETLVRLIARPARGARARDFNTRDTRPIGGRLYEFDSPLYCSPDSFRDEGFEGGIREAFGFWPDSEQLSLGVCCNLPDNHRALADVAAFLAEQTGGVICLGTSHKETAELPGLSRILFRDGIRQRGRATFLDATAMRAWAQRPNCWMPK